MERYRAASHSLYYGPLSQPAERILAALRAQALPPSRNNHSQNHPYSQLDRYYRNQRTQHGVQGRESGRPGSHPEPYSSSSWSRPPSYSSADPHHDSSNETDCFHNPDSVGSTGNGGQRLSSKDYNQPPSKCDSQRKNLPSTIHTLPSPRRNVVLPAPEGSQSDGPYSHNPRLSAQQDTVPWKSLSEEPETTFTLSLSPEDPDLGTFFPDLHQRKPTLSPDKVCQVSDFPPEVQNNIQPGGMAAGSVDGRQNYYWENIPPKHQYKVCLPSLNSIKVPCTGGENDGAFTEGSGSAFIKSWKQLSLPQGKTRPEKGFDKMPSESLKVNSNQGPRVDFPEAIAEGRVEELQNESQMQSNIRCEGSNREREQFREIHGLSRMEGKHFPISITDEMNTLADHGVDGRELRQSENPDGRQGFPHQPNANDQTVPVEGYSQSITPELTPVLIEDGVDPTVTQCWVDAPQKTVEPETAGDMVESPQTPEEQRESNYREPILDGPTTGDGPDTTGRDVEDPPVAEVALETDTQRVVADQTRAEEQMGGEEGRSSHPVQGDEEEDEKAGEGPTERGTILQEMLEEPKEPLLKTSHKDTGSHAMVMSEASPVVRNHTPLRLSQEGGARGSGFRVPPRLHGNAPPRAIRDARDIPQASPDLSAAVRCPLESQQPLLSANEGPRMGVLRVDRPLVTPSTSVPMVASHTGERPARSNPPKFRPVPPRLSRIPAETPDTSCPRCPVRWKPPRSSQGRTGERDGEDRRASGKHTAEEEEEAGTDGPTWKPQTMRRHQHAVKGSSVTRREMMQTSHIGDQGNVIASVAAAATSTCKPPRKKQATHDPETIPKLRAPSARSDAVRGERLADQTAGIASDPRVKDAGRMSLEERAWLRRTVGQARATALTMVYQDGSSQFDPEQNPCPPVCGLLVLMRQEWAHSGPGALLHPGDTCFYLRLDHTPTWAQQHTHPDPEGFSRETLMQVVSGEGLLVCYKAKDLLRTALLHYRPQISWKQVLGCRIQDPQVSGWLLDPADPAICYQDLLTKHLNAAPPPRHAPGTSKASQAIEGLSLLYRLNAELCAKLQSQGLWQLYSTLELSMIPVLAAMESHRVHVDREALKTTSDMLGTKLKQLEQEAHQAAGQIFLVSSSTQLRTVLFDKLKLHERCENKKLPKTINKQQQSTSEAALLQLRDLHPLPKIILEYRQVHKIKSTFVDGVLSCIRGKTYISSTWHQTSAVTGRISAKHPNFQALPRQPVHITKKQYIQGKDAEVVKVHPRNMFIPQEGWTFLAADFCQVELRLLAHLSGDPELLRVFSHAHSDVFTMLASRWKGVKESEVSSEEREHAKRIVYSVVYGAGRERLSGILGVSSEQASRFQDSFLQTYREVQTFIQTTVQQCHQRGYVVSIMGRRRTLPLIHSADWGVRMQAERQAVNFVVQGSAADLCKMAMIRIASQVCSSSTLSARLIAQLHDELLYEVEDSQVERFAGLVKGTMEALQHLDSLRVPLKVPLKVALSSGKSWGSMSELRICAASPSSSPPATLPP